MDKSIERFFKDNFAINAANIEVVKVDKNYAQCKMPISNIHLNGDGVVMGGAIFTLADFTSALAANYGNVPTVSLSGNINFVSAAKDAEYLLATANPIKDGKSSSVFNVEVKDDKGKLIASYIGTGFRKNN